MRECDVVWRAGKHGGGGAIAGRNFGETQIATRRLFPREIVSVALANSGKCFHQRDDWNLREESWNRETYGNVTFAEEPRVPCCCQALSGTFPANV